MEKISVKKSIFIVGIEKFSMILFQFITSIILARLLHPSDYGIIAMLSIFIALSSTIVDSGFGGSLVYYKDVTKKDYSTVFWINILISVSLYSLIYIFADEISEFYETPILTKLVKILGLTIIFNSLGVVQFTILYKNLKFKKIAYVSIITYILSAITTIILAYYGFGVWALICQQVLSSVLRTCILFCLNRFIPDFYFSFSLLKKHWKYGNGLFFSTLLRTIYDNMYVQLIGKYCSIVEAGLYNQAKKLKDIPTNLFSNTFDYSLFPIFSKYKEENIFTEKYRVVNKILGFICVPVFFLIALLSKQIILILLGEKWFGCSSILQWLAIGSIFYIFEMVNRSALKARGLTSLLFRVDLIKRILGVLLMFVLVIPFTIKGIVIAYCINSFIGWMANAYILSQNIHYNLKTQFVDVVRYISLSLLPCVMVMMLEMFFVSNIFISAILSIIIFLFVYLVESKMFNEMPMHYLLNMLHKKTNKHL